MGQIEPSEVFSADAINPVDRCGRQTFSALVIVIPKYVTLSLISLLKIWRRCTRIIDDPGVVA